MKCSECKRDISINPQLTLKTNCRQIVFRCYFCINKIKIKQEELEDQVGIRNIKRIEEFKSKSVNPNIVGISRTLENLRKNPITNNLKSPAIEHPRKVIKINNNINVGNNVTLKNNCTTEKSPQKFKCDLCNFELPSKIKFFYHMKGHRGENRFKLIQLMV